MGNMSKAHTVDDDIYMMIYSRYLNTFTVDILDMW